MSDPHFNENLEANLIGTLIDNPVLIDTAEIEPEDFYQDYAIEAFKSMRDMKLEDKPISMGTVSAALIGKEISMSKFSCDIQKDSTKAWNLDSYVKALKDLSVKRYLTEAIEGGTTSAEIIEKAKMLESKLEGTRLITLDKAYESYLEEYEYRKENQGRMGLTTGFDALDRLAPMAKGNLVTLAARTSIGKSALALSIARNAAEYGHRVVFVTIEMSVIEMMDRLFSALTHVNLFKFKTAQADASIKMLRADVDRLKDKLSFLEMPWSTSMDIVISVTKEHSKEPIDLVIVDYLQILKDAKDKGGNSAERIARMTMNLKALARSCHLVVLCLSQVNREAGRNDSGMPRIDQLRDSGAIEQDSDIVILLNRESRDATEGKVLIGKNRNGPPDKYIDLKFHPETVEYKEGRGELTVTDVENMFDI